MANGARIEREPPLTQTDPAPFLGYWKITWMETWAQTYVDRVGPGFFEFAVEEELLIGTLRFGTIVGWLDCRLRAVGRTIFIEWTWDGQNEADTAFGRGWAEIADGELVGHIFIHGADDSAFKATRQSRPLDRPPATERRSTKPSSPIVH